MKPVAALVLCTILAAPLLAEANTPVVSASNAELPAMPAQEREAAISQGMLLATMAVVLVVLAAAGGLAVYLTRRHQAAPNMKDM